MSRGFQREYHIAVLGSGGVGKSCLTAQFVQGVFIERYDPTIEDSYRKQIDVDGRQVMLEIMDTAGTEQFTSMREMYMRNAQGFLLVFSITSLSSLQELDELREQIAHMKGHDPENPVPIVLVGNKCDLEDDRAVSRARAFGISQAWGGVPYYETSARRKQNVNQVFVDVCRQIIRKDLLAKQRQPAHVSSPRSHRGYHSGRQPRGSPWSNSYPDGGYYPDGIESNNNNYHGSTRHNNSYHSHYPRIFKPRRPRRPRDRSKCVIL